MTGAGSVVFSYVNDGGFWLVKECFELSVIDTVRHRTMCGTLILLTALAIAATLSLLL